MTEHKLPNPPVDGNSTHYWHQQADYWFSQFMQASARVISLENRLYPLLDDIQRRTS